MAKTPAPLSGRGEVYTFSTVYNAPEGFEPYTPYTVASVKLEEGLVVTAAHRCRAQGCHPLLRHTAKKGLLSTAKKFDPAFARR